ncbi:hypothetical protein [Rubellicoccus peritrichatus]|uniref:Uncharacterized protein n=1 Tax=Rubellicoccus peritrichatus TaxID=3080537 RepID=A0AAQ3LD10_9BACT|nr:hypothetical protein [Puniceicoccus sp. CR14]WOO42217.1 hypothetical protein RZN69_03885 [Puniceicoccus sp. CR14]
MRCRTTSLGWFSAGLFRALTACLLVAAASLAVHHVDAASKRKGTTNTKASTETPEKSETEVTERATPVGPMVLSRRIVTKIDGVVVEDREASAVPAPQLPASISLPQETVFEPGASDTVAPTDPIESPEEEPQEQPPVEADTGGGFFDNFFNPQRDANSSGNRYGKRRGKRIQNEQEAETVELPVYEPFIIPDEPVFISSSPNLTVGRIVSINPVESIAVAWMESRFITLERDVVTRNHELETTGVLSPTNFRNGRAYGLKIMGGAPSVGDEVILPELLQTEDLEVSEDTQSNQG